MSNTSTSPNECKQKLNQYRKKRRLNKETKYTLNMLSHYKFRQHLQNKCKEYGCRLIIGTEEYTSQCCSVCGNISKIYINRIKECS